MNPFQFRDIFIHMCKRFVYIVFSKILTRNRKRLWCCQTFSRLKIEFSFLCSLSAKYSFPKKEKKTFLHAKSKCINLVLSCALNQNMNPRWNKSRRNFWCAAKTIHFWCWFLLDCRCFRCNISSKLFRLLRFSVSPPFCPSLE